MPLIFSLLRNLWMQHLTPQLSSVLQRGARRTKSGPWLGPCWGSSPFRGEGKKRKLRGHIRSCPTRLLSWYRNVLTAFVIKILHCKRYQKNKGVKMRWFLSSVNIPRMHYADFIEVFDLPCNSPAIPGWASFLSRRCPSSQIVWLFCDMDICGLGTKLRTLNSISLRREPDFNIAAVQRWRGNEDMRNSWTGKGHLAQQVCPPSSLLQHTSPRCRYILQPCLPM